jgi:hypothetical protein
MGGYYEGGSSRSGMRGMNGIELAQDRNRWLALLKNIRVP